NLRPDAYWYEQDGVGCGDVASRVRFVDLWRDGAPPFGAGLAIADRRGCDRDPIDASNADDRLRALSDRWPDPAERFARADEALRRAAETPVAIDRADAREWVPRQLAERHPGTTLVMFHSVVWQYLGDATHEAIRSALDVAGRSATADAPLAW